MATRGPYIGDVYLERRGLCRMFTDMDSTTHLFLLTSSGEEYYVPRERIPAASWRRRAKAAQPPGSGAPS